MIISFCFHARDSIDEQEILRLNNMLAEYISANTLLKKENNNQEQEITRLKEQLDPVSIKEEPTSDTGLNQFVYIKYMHTAVCTDLAKY